MILQSIAAIALGLLLFSGNISGGQSPINRQRQHKKSSAPRAPIRSWKILKFTHSECKDIVKRSKRGEILWIATAYIADKMPRIPHDSAQLGIVTSLGEAEIFINDKLLGRTSSRGDLLANIRLNQRQTDVTIIARAADFNEASQVITLEQGQGQIVPFKLTPISIESERLENIEKPENTE